MLSTRLPARLWAALFTTLLLPAAALAQHVPDWTRPAPGTLLAPANADGTLLLTELLPAASPNFRVSRMGTAGSLQWQRQPLAGNVDVPNKPARDASGHIVLAGTEGGTAFVARLDPQGNLLWRTEQSPSLGWPAITKAGADGSVYVLQILPATGYTLSKYSVAGQWLWSRPVGQSVPYVWPGALSITGSGLAVVIDHPPFWGRSGATQLLVFDAEGNPLAAQTVPVDLGIGAMVGPAGEYVLVGGSGGQSLVIKHDGQMNELWRQSYAVGGAAFEGAIDPAGQIVFPAASTDASGSTITGYATVKLAATGQLLWARSAGPASDGLVATAGTSIRFGSDGSIFMLGNVPRLGTDAWGGPAEIPRLAVFKLASDGTELWRSALLEGYNGSELLLVAGGGAVVHATHNELQPLLLRFTQSGVPNQAPRAVASASPSAGTAPLAVQLSAAGSVDSDGSIASYLWTFGDGQSSTQAQPSHTYAAGNWVATLTVTDNVGAQATATVPISATAAPLPPPVPTGLALASASVVQLTSTTARVTLSNTAGATVRLSSSNSTMASVPATVTVPAGSNSATFTVTAGAATRTRTATIRATVNGVRASAVRTILPR